MSKEGCSGCLEKIVGPRIMSWIALRDISTKTTEFKSAEQELKEDLTRDPLKTLVQVRKVLSKTEDLIQEDLRKTQEGIEKDKENGIL